MKKGRNEGKERGGKGRDRKGKKRRERKGKKIKEKKKKRKERKGRVFPANKNGISIGIPAKTTNTFLGFNKDIYISYIQYV